MGKVFLLLFLQKKKMLPLLGTRTVAKPAAASEAVPRPSWAASPAIVRAAGI